VRTSGGELDASHRFPRQGRERRAQKGHEKLCSSGSREDVFNEKNEADSSSLERKGAEDAVVEVYAEK